jgi:hypothetical protein
LSVGPPRIALVWISYHEETTLEVRYPKETTLGSAGFLPVCFMLVSCYIDTSILKVEAAFSSEKFDNFQRASRSEIPEYELGI